MLKFYIPVLGIVLNCAFLFDCGFHGRRFVSEIDGLHFLVCVDIGVHCGWPFGVELEIGCCFKI